MEKKVLVINGSPKGKASNTYKLANAFVHGFEVASDGIELEEINVNKLNISSGCKGCFSCWSKTPGKCVINDDMKMVMEKILWADVIVWSFGLYYFSVPGQLKNLIDRTLPLVQPFMATESDYGGHPARYDMSKKRSVVISTCGFYTAKGNYDAVNFMFDRFVGKGNYETIYCGQGELFRVPELSARTSEYLKSVEKAGREFCDGKITEGTKSNLQELLMPKEIFEKMADTSWGVDKTTGEKVDEELIFTKQMAALYNKSSYNGKDLVLEMDYTDVGKSYQILMKKDGYEVLTDNFIEPTTKIETPYTVWKDISVGKISGQDAMMQGLYKVKGDFNLMINWDKYFGVDSGRSGVKDSKVSSSSKNEYDKPKMKKTNMAIMLIPWITFWIAGNFSSIGAIVTIIVCAIVGLIYAKNEKTPYDTLSNAIVTIFSVILLMNANANILIPLAYLALGLMWTISCFTKVPLSAHYSKNGYGGNKAFQNPLFMKTNKILSLGWGILYIATSIWTFFLIGKNFSIALTIVNNMMPILMGIFTGWFQKWYPAWYARK